jgi:hypothetical protein
MVDGNQPCLMLTNVTVTKLDPMRPTSRRRRFLAPKFRWWCYLPEKNKENSPKKGDELLFYFFGSYYIIIHIYIYVHMYIMGCSPTNIEWQELNQLRRTTDPFWKNKKHVSLHQNGDWTTSIEQPKRIAQQPRRVYHAIILHHQVYGLLSSVQKPCWWCGRKNDPT